MVFCNFSYDPESIESVWFTCAMEGYYVGLIERVIPGTITSDSEFEAFITGLTPSTDYKITAFMTITIRSAPTAAGRT